MSDPTKVYGGGIPQGGFDAEQSGAGFDLSKEAESAGVPNGPTKGPGKVSDGGPTQAKTYDKNASQDFVLDGDYKTDLEVAARPATAKTVNPNDLSNSDHC